MTLEEQIHKMVAAGAFLQHNDTLERVGWVQVDECHKCLFFMRPWAKEPEDAHIFHWVSYDQGANSVRFYGALGQVEGLLASIPAFRFNNTEHELAKHAEWKKEFVENEARYLDLFRTEIAFLKLRDPRLNPPGR
jgi:hypothetical protein